MSRIHEALRKAEQEHAAKPDETLGVSGESSVVAPAAEVPMPSLSGGGLTRTSAGVAQPGNFLRFDDLRGDCPRPQWNLDPDMNVFSDSETGARAAEQFRTLRTRLYQIRSSGTSALRTVLVTSAIPAEGKTFVSHNLAQAIVRQPDRRVLLIDADLRCARLHVPLGAPSAPGLSDYLRGDADERAVIQFGPDGNLCFIPGGQEVTNPSELLSNGRLKTLLERVTPVFDWVILDSPPCLPVADSSLLAQLCDAVLLVVRAGSTPAETALKACQELKGKNIAGVVLNVVEESVAYGTHYYERYSPVFEYIDPKNTPRQSSQPAARSLR